jgi:hypothetical protein
MKMSHLRWSLGLLVMLVVGVLVLTVSLRIYNMTAIARYNRIHLGMPYAEVLKVMNRPPDDVWAVSRLWYTETGKTIYIDLGEDYDPIDDLLARKVCRKQLGDRDWGCVPVPKFVPSSLLARAASYLETDQTLMEQTPREAPPPEQSRSP